VTYPSSRYFDRNFNHNLSGVQSSTSLSLRIETSDKNLSRRKIGLLQIIRHYITAVILEVRFSRYLSREMGKIFFFVLFGKKFRDVLKLVLRLFVDREKFMAECSRLRRFDNINLSHLSLFEAALKDECSFLIVLEDDAFATNPAAFDELILEIQKDADLLSAPIILNASISNDFRDMGINGLDFIPVKQKSYSATPFPITNSACANVYSRRFVELLLQNSLVVAEKGLANFIPIDQILNMLILKDSKDGQKIVTYHMALPVFRQLSMPSN
jgi:hypothetical protein